MIGRAAVLVSMSVVFATETAARAQTASAPDVMVRPHAFEIGATVGWAGGFDLGSASATLHRNPSVGQEPFTLFAADGRQHSAPAFGVTIGYVVSPRLSVEAFGTLSRPQIRFVISQDAELGGSADVSQGGLTEYGFGGNLLIHLPGLAIRGRLVPFVQAGAGVLWQVAADTSAERGHLIRVGTGVRYLFSSRPGRKLGAAGLRGDVLLLVRNGDLQLDSSRHVTAAAGGGVFLAF